MRCVSIKVENADFSACFPGMNKRKIYCIPFNFSSIRIWMLDFFFARIVQTRLFLILAWNLPRKAVGEMIPVRLATSIVVPDSRNGDVKSTAASLSALTYF